MMSDFKDVKEKVGREIMEVDFFGPVLLTQNLLPGMTMYPPHFMDECCMFSPPPTGMLSNGFGHIVNIASMGGKIPVEHVSYYCAAKSALIALMNVLHLEVGRQGL